MEWKNYLELDHNPDLYNKYLLNMNENISSNDEYISNDNNNNFNYFKKYTPNCGLDNYDEGNNNNKIDYYNLINNPNSDFYNLEENSYLSPVNHEESEEKKMNKLSSESSNNEIKGTNKKKIFKTQTFSSVTKEESSKNKELSISEDINNNSNSGMNFLHNMPLNERMKIKKEKTKKLLENKKKRESIEEETKEKNEQTKIQENNMLNALDKTALSKLSKKEIKMWRNRLSAQRSRDRRKKELLDLKIITKNLLQENQKLRNGIKERDDRINQLINLLCPDCKNKLNGNNQFEISVKTNNDFMNNNNDKTQLTPSSIISGKKKLAFLMTGLFTIFCVFGTLINPSDNNILRSLKEKGGNKNSTKIDFNGEKRVNVPFIIEKDYTIRHQKEIEMYQKIKKYNLKNKNMMVPASLFTNNSEQIISNINQKMNNNSISDNKTIIEEKKDDNDNKMIEENNSFLSKRKIKIIDKEFSNKNNDDLKNENNNK